MLSAADADIAGRDPSLPALSTLLDPDAFRAALCGVLPAAEIAEAVPSYVRYKPRTNCLVGYDLRTPSATLRVYAKAHGKAAAEKLAKAEGRGGAFTSLDSAQVLLPKLGIVVRIFPNDAKLRTLQRIVDPQAFRRLMARVIPGSPDLWEGSVELLRYKPERRMVACLASPSGARTALRVFDKSGLLNPNAAARHLASRGDLKLASRLGVSKRKGVLALEWISGRKLGSELIAQSPELSSLERVGAALANLHGQSTPAFPADFENEPTTAKLASDAGAIGFLCPDLEPRARQLSFRIAGALKPAGTPLYSLHGDFYWDQVLLREDNVVLLDLDRAHHGDPREDLGNFIAHLELAAVLGEIPAESVEPAAELLLEGYSKQGGRRPAPLEAFVASALLRLSVEPFRRRLASWRRCSATILERGEDWVRRQRPVPLRKLSSYREQPCDPKSAAGDCGIPWLADALDLQKVSRKLRSAIIPETNFGGKARVLDARVLRHRPGRRCLVEYQVECRHSSSQGERTVLIGKTRARGLDFRTYKLSLALFRGSFGAEASDGICVPEPLGVIPEFRMWLQRRVPGVPAGLLLAKRPETTLAHRVAEALYKLHREQQPVRRRHGVADELSILRGGFAQVSALHPEWKARLERLGDACDLLASRITATEPVGIHRDFYADQLIVNGDQIFILDLDLYAAGDPALDVGNFIGHVTEQSLRAFGEPEALGYFERAIEDRYLELSGSQRRSQIRNWAMLSLARHVYISSRIPERAHMTERLLELCEERLGSAGVWATQSR